MSDRNEPPFDCPGGPAVKVGRFEGECLDCGYRFFTLTDEPVLAPHRTSGDWITFGGQTARRSDRR